MASEATKTIKKVDGSKEKDKKKNNKKKSVKKTEKKGRGLKGFIDEMRRVTWPTGKQLASATGAVILFTACITVVVGMLDWGLMSLLKLFYN